MRTISQLIRRDLADFVPYSSARSEADEGSVWLDANESPWDTCFELTSTSLNRYAEQQPKALVEACTRFYQVKQEQLLITHGSDAAIDLIIRLFCRAYQDAIMICPPTFIMYQVSAKLQGAKLISVPLIASQGFSLDKDAVLKNWNPSIKVLFLCSPNNPIGNSIKQEDLLFLCKNLAGKCAVVVDEAYIEFSENDSLSAHINQFDNLIVLRTLSKAFGLAGARLGVVLANNEIIKYLRSILAPYPLSSLSVQAALQVLEQDAIEKVQKRIKLIKTERDKLFVQFNNLNIVKQVWPSDANFLLVQFNHSDEIQQACFKQGIVIREMGSKTGISDTMRITVGKPNENKALIECIEAMGS